MNVIVEDVGHAIKDMQKELLRIKEVAVLRMKEVAVDTLAYSILFLYIFIYF